MNDVLQPKQRASRYLLILILICFAGLAGARLNRLYFFNPDSADYVIMARGLVNHLAYRQFDLPGAPPFTLRPPGLSLLLIPAALIAPYDAILAKVTVILFAILLLALLYALICRLRVTESEVPAATPGRVNWPAFCIIVLLATNPHFLLFSTLIMSEIPFMAFSLAIFYLLARNEGQLKKGNLILLTALLVFLPLLRTIGIALILAIGIWAVLDRKRWSCLIPACCALATTGLWMLRNSAMSTDHYSSLLVENLKSLGLTGTLVSMINRSLVHFESLCQTIIPNMPGEVPAYERYLLEGNQPLPGPPIVYSLICVLVIALSLYGMLRNARRGGTVCLLYLGITFGILSVWPWMQSRFTLPLLPLILAYLPAGIEAAFDRFTSIGTVGRRVLVSLVVLPGIVLCLMQLKTDGSLIAANQLLLREGDRFYESQYPSSHYSNFVKAGDWLKEQTLPETRVLTRRNDLATSSHRFQRLTRFEKTSPKKLHETIRQFSANYLVSFDKNSIDAFPWHLLNDDLVYRLTPVYEQAGVVILEIQPNYTGTIRNQFGQENESLQLARKIQQQFPNRLSAQIAYLRQLLAAEQYEEGIEFVASLGDVSDVHLTNFLGWAYVGNREFQKALEEFDKASRMPGQVSIRESIQRGITLSRKQLARANAAEQSVPTKTPRQNLNIAREFWKRTFYRKANAYAQKVIDSEKATDDERDEAHIILARFHLITGKTEPALRELKLIQNPETPDLQQLTERLRLEKSLESLSDDTLETNSSRGKPDPEQVAAVLKLVEIYDAEGVPGKALQLLTQTAKAAPQNVEILQLLAKYQLFFNLLPEAETSYQHLQQLSPSHPDTDMALKRIAELKQLPQF